jgi:hypothetical protein
LMLSNTFSLIAMIEFEIKERERGLLLTVLSIDLEAAQTLLAAKSSYHSTTLPRVTIERAEQHAVSFYPDQIRISISTDKPLEAPIERFQTLKFDELLGKDTPIVVKKRDERLARMKRVRFVLEQFRSELKQIGS